MYPVKDEFGLVSEFFLWLSISFAIDAVNQFEEAILSPFGSCLRKKLIIVLKQNVLIMCRNKTSTSINIRANNVFAQVRKIITF